MKKITLAGLKSFIRKHKDNLYIKVKSDFDGMVDGVMPVDMDWQKVEPEKIDFTDKNTLGIAHAWLVGDSRDYCYLVESGDCVIVSNCCGRWEICTK